MLAIAVVDAQNEYLAMIAIPKWETSHKSRHM